MRTTLTLDDDLMAALRERAQREGASFKSTINDVVRRGLSVGAPPASAAEPFRVEPHACGFRAGIDVGRLNQLVDELESERFGDLTVHDAASEDPADDST